MKMKKYGTIFFHNLKVFVDIMEKAGFANKDFDLSKVEVGDIMQITYKNTIYFLVIIDSKEEFRKVLAKYEMQAKKISHYKQEVRRWIQ